MPMGDGTGPGGPGSGRGQGGGRGRMGGFNAGPGGNCVCPQCGEVAQHLAAQPCAQKKCPRCGTPMTRMR